MFNRDVFLKWSEWLLPIILVILGMVLYLIIASFSQSFAHDWYEGKTSPTGQLCCGDYDCIPLEYNQFYLDKKTDEYVITLHSFKTGRSQTLQGQQWYPAGRQVYRFPHKNVQPTEGWKPGQTGFHVCILFGKAVCFFEPQGS